MSKTLLSVALIVGFGMAAFAPQTAHATDGTISFTGAVTGMTCTITVNGGSASTAVVLPTVSTSVFTTANTTAGSTAINIALTGCTGGTAGGLSVPTKVSAFFETGPWVNKYGRLVNTNSITSGTVDVQLADALGNPIVIGVSALPAVALGNAGATMTYFARYYATATPVSAGPVAAQVQYSIAYQ